MGRLTGKHTSADQDAAGTPADVPGPDPGPASGTLDALRAEVDTLRTRVADLEDQLTESRSHQLRLAELLDVVQELLLPLGSRDDARVQRAIEAFNASL